MLKRLKDKWYLFPFDSFVGIVLLSIFVYLVATQTWFSGRGELIIGFIGVILLGFSFLVQYQANIKLSEQNEKLSEQNTYNSLLDSINILKDDINKLSVNILNDFFENFHPDKNPYNKEYGVQIEYVFRTYIDIGQQVWEFENSFLIRRMHTIFNTYLLDYCEKAKAVEKPENDWYKVSHLISDAKKLYDEFEEHLKLNKGKKPDTSKF